MHETKFAGQIITLLTAKLGEDMYSKSVTVHVRLSPFSHVTPRALEEAFRQLIEGESFRNVRLAIEPLELEVYCRSCGRISRIEKSVLSCPRCGEGDIEIKKDMEFFVHSIDIEDA